MTLPNIILDIPVPEKKAEMLHDGLARAGQTLRAGEYETFLLSVPDDRGGITAGCKGEVTFRSLHVSELWVDEKHRGSGLGSALLSRAEDLARERDCIRVHLETRNEGARVLYERLGYRVFGRLPDYNGDQAFYYLEKRLDGAN